MDETEEFKKTRWPWPIRLILSVFLITILIVMAVPYWSVKNDPNPTNIPSLEDIAPDGLQIVTGEHRISSHSDIVNFVQYSNPSVKQAAGRIAAQSCPEDNGCYAKALFYFVRDNIKYISDPPDEYIETPMEVLYAGGSDCDGHAVLLASLLESIGISTEFVFVPGHVFLRAEIDELSRSYKTKGYVYMDPTCKSCDIGEMPFQYSDSPKTII